MGGGEVLVHAGKGGAEASFEIDDLAEVERRCAAAGFEVVLADEAYGRTALIAGPDERRIWVNERQRDLYGYEEVAAVR